MINLLPPEEKEGLLLEKQKKIVIILGITVLVPIICLVLILASITLFVLGEVNYQKILLAQDRKQYQTADFLKLRSAIQNSDAELSQLDSFYKKEVPMSDVLKTIASLQFPNNLAFTSLALQRNQDQSIGVMASGTSDTRDDLLLFQKNIQANSQIENPFFSPDSWVNAKNAAFHLSFTFQKQTNN